MPEPCLAHMASLVLSRSVFGDWMAVEFFKTTFTLSSSKSLSPYCRLIENQPDSYILNHDLSVLTSLSALYFSRLHTFYHTPDFTYVWCLLLSPLTRRYALWGQEFLLFHLLLLCLYIPALDPEYAISFTEWMNEWMPSGEFWHLLACSFRFSLDLPLTFIESQHWGTPQRSSFCLWYLNSLLDWQLSNNLGLQSPQLQE